MRGKALFCLLVLCLLVGGASADTLILTVSEDSRTSRYVVTGETLSTIIAGDGIATSFSRTATATNVYVATHGDSPKYLELRRVLETVNLTNPVLSGATINSAKLRVWSGGISGTATTFSANIRLTNATSPTNPFVHAYTDYNKQANIIMANNVTRESWPATGISQDFEFNSNGLSFLRNNIGGTVTFMLRSSTDVDGVIDGTWESGRDSTVTFYTIDNVNETLRPKLIIEYTVPDTTPPASITGLANVTTTCEQITWTWDDSISDDADQVMIWKDNVYLHNVSANATEDVWSSLTGGQTYEFASKTCDFTGNCNATWVNMSATASVCADTTPPESITNLANSTATCEQITWSWTDSTSDDADVVQIWKDNVFFHNVTSSDQQDVWTSLTGGQTYEFASHTCDTTGNCNTLWVNQSATPSSCTVAPVANFTANVTSGCSALDVGLTDTSTNSPTDWDWYWFDNETKSSDLQNPTVTLTTGTYSVRLYASNSAGGDWLNQTNLITVTDCGGPTANFVADNTTVCLGNTIQFNDTSTSPSALTGWSWDFGDSNTSAVQNVSYTYRYTGLFTVILNVTNAYAFDTEEKVDYITVNDCTPPTIIELAANFASNVTCGNVPFTVMFNDTSTGTNITDWYYDFGDGNTSILQNDTNTYSTVGLYSIAFSVTNDTAAVSWKNVTGYIRAVPDWSTCTATATSVEVVGNSDDSMMIIAIVGALISGLIAIGVRNL